MKFTSVPSGCITDLYHEDASSDFVNLFPFLLLRFEGDSLQRQLLLDPTKIARIRVAVVQSAAIRHGLVVHTIPHNTVIPIANNRDANRKS